MVFLMKREMPNLLSVKCETAILFSMKRDQYPPLPPSRSREKHSTTSRVSPSLHFFRALAASCVL